MLPLTTPSLLVNVLLSDSDNDNYLAFLLGEGNEMIATGHNTRRILQSQLRLEVEGGGHIK